MAGSPIKRARREIAEAALLRAATIDRAIIQGYEEGVDPVDLMMPVASRLYDIASRGDIENAVTLGAIKEVFDRVSGKVAQELQVDPLGLEDLESALEQISERRRARMLAAQAIAPLIERDVTPSGAGTGNGDG